MSTRDVVVVAIFQLAFGFCLGAIFGLGQGMREVDRLMKAWRESSAEIFAAWRQQIDETFRSRS